MEKLTLKLFEIRDLNAEINGLVNVQTGEKVRKGLLDEKLSMTQKYWLSDLGKKAKALTDEVEPLRNELITKYGEKTSDETVEVLPWIEEKNEEGEVTARKPNPKFLDFEREYSELFNQEREFEHRVFFIEDFEDVKSENDYTIFRKFCTSREESPLQVVK
jgi:hypothetical protein